MFLPLDTAAAAAEHAGLPDVVIGRTKTATIVRDFEERGWAVVPLQTSPGGPAYWKLAINPTGGTGTCRAR